MKLAKKEKSCIKFMYPFQVVTKELHSGLRDVYSTGCVILGMYNTSTGAFLEISQGNSLLYGLRSIGVKIGKSTDQR